MSPVACYLLLFIVALHSASRPIRDNVLAKPNYSFEKRQRDLEKKRKQEEKRLRKLAEKKPADDGCAELSSEESAPSDADPAGAGH
jgi:hypothetical protein